MKITKSTVDKDKTADITAPGDVRRPPSCLETCKTNGMLSTVTHAHRIQSSWVDRLLACITREVDASLGVKASPRKVVTHPNLRVTQEAPPNAGKGREKN